MTPLELRTSSSSAVTSKVPEVLVSGSTASPPPVAPPSVPTEPPVPPPPPPPLCDSRLPCLEEAQFREANRFDSGRRPPCRCCWGSRGSGCESVHTLGDHAGLLQTSSDSQLWQYWLQTHLGAQRQPQCEQPPHAALPSSPAERCPRPVTRRAIAQWVTTTRPCTACCLAPLPDQTRLWRPYGARRWPA